MDSDVETKSSKSSCTSNMDGKYKGKVDSSPISEISIKEFLNFLKTAYQVQDSIENILTANGMTDAVEWLKRKETLTLLNQNSVSCQTPVDAATQDEKKELTRRKSTTSQASGDCEPLKRKLGEVISEGLLDSILPYLVHPTSSKKSILSLKPVDKVEKSLPVHSSTSVPHSDKSISRRSSETTLKPLSNVKTESEVEIHVCDELKSAKKTFFCNQNLLVSKMGYFASVTRGQRLEDMDISVHCDIGIFEWLMQWIKKDSLPETEWPQLESNYVIPILVSAAFLEMESLLEDCLLFCHQYMNDILKTNTNLSCLNDSVLTRLAAMYTNVEVEAIKDKKDKVQSRLFTKLIQSLAEPEPESVRGHWCSLARVFRCEKCQLLITPDVASKITCVPSCMRLQPDGSIMSLHVRDSNWDINTYIIKLFKSLKSWRKVYWRLWGDAHFLFCFTCQRYFPSNQIGWCRYHPDTPQFFTLDAQKAPLPIGRFPCCGERSYRFQLLENFNGCHFRQHTVLAEDVKDASILSMLETYRHLIEEEPPQLLFPEKLTRLVARDPNACEKKFVCKEVFWWDGLEVIPPRPKLGLLSNFVSRGNELDETDESSGEYTDESTTSVSSDTEGSAESNPRPRIKPVKRKKTKRKHETSLWQLHLSARSNQDIQRAYEEKTIREMTEFLNRNVVIDSLTKGKGISQKTTPIGGMWMRLEQEWKEHSQKNGRPPVSTQPAKNSRFRGK